MPPPKLPEQLVRRKTFRTRDAEAMGVSRPALRRYLDAGLVERDARGVYQVSAAEPNPYFQYGVLVSRGVSFVMSLLAALHFHDFTEQLPSSLWITVRQGSHCPVGTGLHTICTYLKEPAYSAFVQHVEIEGLSLPVYSPAKTVADCFKFRNKIGLDVALEALHDGWRKRKFTIDELMAAAKVDRVERVMRPYAEGMLVP